MAIFYMDVIDIMDTEHEDDHGYNSKLIGDLVTGTSISSASDGTISASNRDDDC